ncbi:MAG: hypothetical protein LC102_09145 [Ignavibacteriales bacterium]|nr:hypothetical protein [Ignavibacteriaceae bacterium]MBW7872860.1 hypothetical protein [Ignavibacteria bacterium]MBZ0197260.1 hypothetical protein [Ignavibacteriaceae bacterium]MCZ2143580.1 hypothetical protein [Ignavibacteriales bacterium]WKZ72098.1 MAG: hypothetical protein QY308_10765 [Ignavibacteriaceae bacterium]
MFWTIVAMCIGVILGIFISSVLSAAKWHDIMIENCVLRSKLIQIYKPKTPEDYNEN